MTTRKEGRLLIGCHVNIYPEKAQLLGEEDGWMCGCCSNKFTSHELSEPETVIRPDYLLEYINIALTCQ